MNKEKNQQLKVFIALALLAASSIGVVSNCTGVFYNVLSESLNVKRGMVTAYSTICSIASAIAAVYIPKKMNQHNYKRMLLVGNLLTSISMVLIGQVKSIVLVYVLAVFMGIGLSCFAHTVVNLLIANNISKNAGKLSSMIFLMTGITGIVLSPVLTSINESTSYSMGYMVAGLFCFLFALPCQFIDLKVDFHDEKKENTNHKTSKSLYALFLWMSFLFFVVSNFPQHLMGYSEVRGFSAQAGSVLLSFAMVGNVAFKPINGILSDKIGVKKASILIIFVNFIGLLLIYTAKVYWLAAVGCVLFGTHYTMTSFLHGLLSRDIFPSDYYSVFPKMAMAGTLGGAVASILIASCFDFTGSYDTAMIVILCIDIFNMIALVVLDKKTTNKTKESDSNH